MHYFTVTHQESIFDSEPAPLSELRIMPRGQNSDDSGPVHSCVEKGLLWEKREIDWRWRLFKVEIYFAYLMYRGIWYWVYRKERREKIKVKKESRGFLIAQRINLKAIRIPATTILLDPESWVNISTYWEINLPRQNAGFGSLLFIQIIY